MSPLTLLLLQIGFLLLLWFFVFAVVYALRADVFGVRARKLPEPAAAAVSTPLAAPKEPKPQHAKARKTGPATTETAHRIVITSGPKAGLEVALGTEPLTIGRSSDSGLVIRDDYTSSHHARLMVWGEQWMLQDLDSTNGTRYDGTRVTAPVAIQLGVPIKVGATTFELQG